VEPMDAPPRLVDTARADRVRSRPLGCSAGELGGVKNPSQDPVGELRTKAEPLTAMPRVWSGWFDCWKIEWISQEGYYRVQHPRVMGRSMSRTVILPWATSDPTPPQTLRQLIPRTDRSIPAAGVSRAPAARSTSIHSRRTNG
jgi:hypothetical protein